MKCLVCGRKLRSPKSQEVGYGPVCYRRLFVTILRSSRKDSLSETADTHCCNIPGQMTIDEYLHTVTE